MPGSLNYSPSGSEGGRSLDKSLVGVDLTTTPGTTPLKWRKKGSDNGDSLEGSNVIPVVKAAEPGQSRVPPRTATRKDLVDSSQTTSSSIADAGTQKPEPAAPFSVNVVRPRAASLGRSSTQAGGEKITLLETSKGEVANSEPEHTQLLPENNPGKENAKKKDTEVSSEPASAAVWVHDDTANEELVPRDRKDSHEYQSGSEALGEDHDIGDGGGSGSIASNRCAHTTDNRNEEGYPRSNEPSLAPLYRYEKDTYHHDHCEGSHGDGSDEPSERSKDKLQPANELEEGPVDHESSSTYCTESLRQTVSKASPSASPRESTDIARGEKEHRRYDRQQATNLSVQVAERSSDEEVNEKLVTQCERGLKPRAVKQIKPTSTKRREADGKDAFVVKKEEEDDGQAQAESQPHQESQQSQQQEQQQPERLNSQIHRKGSHSLENPVQGGGNVETHLQGDDGAGEEGEHSLNENTQVNNRGNGSPNRELQSPPVLSRKSGRQVPASTVGRTDELNEGTPKRERLASQHDGFSPTDSPVGDLTLKLQQPGFSASHDQPSTPQRLAPLTPRSRRASSLPSSLSPQSPVAAAAHAVSLEESSRSTARMKRAAEAIALEDETLSLSRSRARNLPESERREQRRKPPERWALTPESENSLRREEDKRAKHEESIRLRALREAGARRDADTERDRALELTLEVLRRRHVEKRRARGRSIAQGRKRAHSPQRRTRIPEDHRSCIARTVKDSTARSCGLSAAQVVLLRRSREIGRNNGKPKKPTGQRRDDLAQPKEERPATRTRNPRSEALVEQLTRGMTDKDKGVFLHACLADAKECTHRPHTRLTSHRSRGGCHGEERRGNEEGEGAKDESGTKEAFLYRMDAQERAKTAAMEHRRGELAYKTTLDKRVCPGCGAEQSYDEVQEKRKTCPICEKEYRKPRTWAAVRQDFFKRVEAFEEGKRASLHTVAKDKEAQLRALARGIHDGAEGREPLYWDDIEDDFISRLQEDVVRRQGSLEKSVHTLSEDLTFQPKLSSASKQVASDSPWAGMTFLQRVEADLQRRREAATAGFIDELSSDGNDINSYNTW